MQIICDFKYFTFSDDATLYTCFINNQEISTNVDLILIGNHKSGHSNNDVMVVVFKNCKFAKVPKGVTKLFPKMKDLSIWNSNLNCITNNDLEEYKHLEGFALCGSDVTTLPGNLFDGFHNLKDISFNGNKLKTIEPNILDGLNKLTYVNFSQNVNYNQFFSIVPNNLGFISLDELKNELYKIFGKNPENIRLLIKMHKNELDDVEKANAHLIQKNQLLTLSEKNSHQEIQSLKKSIFELNSQNGLNNEIRNLIKDNSLKDFKVIIGDHEFDVHKFLLIARSPTLAEILRNNPYVENLKLIDIPVEIFENVLNFVYTDEFSCESSPNLLQLFAAAGRLKINKLKENIALKILDHINPENALDVLKLSNKYDHNELRIKSFGKIKEMYPKMLFMDEWACETEQIMKAIELFKKKEEAIKRIEENFWKELNQKK